MRPRYRLIISEIARHDILKLRVYLIVQAGAATAEHVIDRLLEKITTLDQFPERGPIPAELQRLRYKEYRQASVPPYRIIYKIAGHDLTILIVADGRRDFQKLLTDRITR